MAHVINGIFHFTYHVQHTCGVFVACGGPSWAVYPCTSAESPSYHAVSCNMQTGSFVSPLHFQLTKCYQAQICICSVLKDGRAFLGTLAGPGSTPAQLRMVAGPHLSSCKLRPGTSVLCNCWEHGVSLLQFSSHAVARPACPV